MSEKMLVTQALDERDLLVKKIGDKIERIRFTDTKVINEEKTMTDRVTPDEFKANASAAFQQIMDLIDRYQRLDAAIVASNAKTMIETSYGKYSVAGAIALRNRLNEGGIYDGEAAFEKRLVDIMEQQYSSAVQAAETKNKNLEIQASNMRLSILGRDGKAKDEKPLAVVDEYIRQNTTEVIDPLEVQKEAAKLNEKIDTLVKELDTQIKVSNATTTITF